MDLADVPFSININRSVSRLKSIFLNFFGTFQAADQFVIKESNGFFHPMYETGVGEYDYAKELELQIELGSKLYPEYPI